MKRDATSLFLATWLLALMNILPVAAQEHTPPTVLVVTIRDGAGSGIAGVLVVIHDHSGTNEFARAQTDTTGMATIATLPTQDIRVSVRGQTPSGVTLALAGADTAGIAITLALPPNQLDLRVEPDGTVIPDPATMLALESGIPIENAAPIPTAVLPTSSHATATVIAHDSVAATTPLENVSNEPSMLAGVAVALLLACFLITLLILLGRWRLRS